MTCLITDETKQLSQIAQQLNSETIDIAESTVRKYARLYKEFLPSRKLEGVRWEKYQANAVDIIRRIFVLSNTGKSRYEIKAQLKADGYGITLEEEAAAADDTASESAQPYNHTSSETPVLHGHNLPELQSQYGDLITHYNASVMREAAESLKLYHRLMEEKNFQIHELEALVEWLRKEKAEVQKKYHTELSKVMDEVIRWRARTTPKKPQPKQKLEPA